LGKDFDEKRLFDLTCQLKKGFKNHFFEIYLLREFMYTCMGFEPQRHANHFLMLCEKMKLILWCEANL